MIKMATFETRAIFAEVVEVNFRKLKNLGNTKLPWFILANAIVAYVVIVGYWAVSRFQSYQATLWDLGIMAQAIWNTAHGRILQESVNLGFSVSRLHVAHWELIYLPLALIYRVFPSIPLLLWLQTLMLACGAIPIFLLAKQKLDSEVAALFAALAYLFYPALHGANLFDIHGLTLAIPLLLFTFLYLTREKYSAALAFAIISLLCREDVALVIFMLGWYVLISRRNSRVGAVLIFISALWLLAFACRSYFWPMNDIPSSAKSAAIVSEIRENEAIQVVIGLVQTPIATLTKLIQVENVVYAAKLLLPVAGLCLFAPSIMLLSAPNLLMNLLSPWHYMHQIEYHYSAAIIPFIFLAAVQGLANILRHVRRYRKVRWFSTEAIMGIVLLSAMVSAAHFSILRFHRLWQVTPQHRMLSDALRDIPAQLSVSTTAREGAHLAERQYLYHFPERVNDADIVVLDLKRPLMEIKAFADSQRTRRLPAMNELSWRVLRDSSWGLRFAIDNTFCLQRGLASKESFARYALQDSLPAGIDGRLNIQVGSGIWLVGWSTVYIGADQAHFQLYWYRAAATPPGSPVKFLLQSEHWSREFDHQLLFGRLQFEGIPPGKILCDHLFINNPQQAGQRTFAVAIASDEAIHKTPRVLFSFNFPER
ncbi:MAG: DUF2079 domain-containing protein [candidate division KSB1 bacterium]|nr:DUF2079 domain-containing protein [candidate division KSB1 bacterium]MDZ7318587.1 DUF2079 domain-containing protein [candidate division KSB1 bacterium]MDZ7339723.1 DUF2079 domain-containing protein [candidate division KSB1 bacterium]